MTGVLWRAFYGYPADIRSSGSDILRISDAQGFRQGSRAEGKRRTRPRRASGGARHLTQLSTRART